MPSAWPSEGRRARGCGTVLRVVHIVGGGVARGVGLMSESEETRAPVPGRDVTGLVPTGLRVSAALAWRFIVVIAALYAIVWLAGYFSHLLVPMAIALLLAALMAPGVERLVTWGVPRWAAAVIVMVAGIVLLGGL